MRPIRSTLVLLASSLAVLSASTATAAGPYPIAGNMRFQMGKGVPIPIGFTAIPNGRVLAIPGATIQQTAGPDPKQITIAQGQLTHAANPITLPVFPANSNVFEIMTSHAISFPKQAATLMANGRTGAAIVSFCPGQNVTTNGNPMCASGTAGVPVKGRMRYVKTTNQFGGPAQAAVVANGKAVLRASAFAPCAQATNPGCLVITAVSNQIAASVLGAPFGHVATTAGPAPNPGLFRATVSAAGSVTNRTAGLGPGLPNPATSFGGPWTTGMISVSAKSTLGGGTESFTLTGSDNRINGVGTISLVSGAVRDSGLNGPKAGRGWLNLTISPAVLPVPGLVDWGVGALALTLIGVAVHKIRRTPIRSY